MFRFFVLDCLIVALVEYVLLVLLFGFVVHRIISSIVVVFEIQVNIY